MDITLEFLLNDYFETDEIKDFHKRALDLIYEDFYNFVKEEKDFWITEIKNTLRDHPQFAKMKEKRLDHVAFKSWLAINRKNVRKAYPLETIYECYEEFSYNEETDEFTLIRKPDDEEDLETTETNGDTTSVEGEDIIDAGIESIEAEEK